MAQLKTKKNSPWVQCETCFINIINKDSDKHLADCPSVFYENYGFVKDNILFGNLDIKTKEDIKGVTDIDFLVFLSQGVIQLCGLAIGEWAIIKFHNKDLVPLAKIVWPTTEKSLTSVLLSKQTLQLLQVEINSNVFVSGAPEDLPEAYKITIIGLNIPKSFEITTELCNRIQSIYSDKLFCVGNRISVMFFGRIIKFELKLVEGSPNEQLDESLKRLQTDTQTFYKTTNKTKWSIHSDATSFEESNNTNLISKIGGLDEEILEILEAINACIKKSKKSYGLKHSRSILLYGNSGTGKTLLAKALSKEAKANIIEICASDLYSKYTGNVEETIKNLFEEAIQHSPSIIILDEVDILCPIRTQRMTDSEKRIVSTLLNMLDNLNHSHQVFILATTNKLDSIDPVFRRYGRFDREIEISTPNPKNRKQILLKLLTNVQHELTDLELDEISRNTHGFVGADLVSLCSRAGLNASKENNEKITLDDFKLALKFVRPSAMREVQIEIANVRWSDIGGQENLKLILKQAVEWPLRHPDSFIRLGVTPPKGVLMFGPPGCSKTMIAKALATESGLNFLSIKGPELFSKWVGESEKAVREVFRKARQVAPSIIFFDEIDALGGERSSGSSTSVQERVLAQLLTELDGVSPLGDVTVLAATNRPDRIDKALLRPGRLDRIVYVPLPDENTRRDIFKLKFAKMPVINVDIEILVRLTHGYSGAEVNAVCHEAAMLALEESLDAKFIQKHHFDKALQLIIPRTPTGLIKLYEDYIERNI